MAKTATNARVYGGEDSAVFVAPTGTTAPTDPTSDPDVAFVEVGWLSDNGVTENRSVNATQVYAMQNSSLIRTVKSQDTATFAFEALEENAVVLGLARPGSTATTTTGVTHTSVKASTVQDLRAFVIDLKDGGVNKRYIIPNGEVTSYPAPAYQGTNVTVWAFTVTPYPDSNGVFYEEYQDAAGVAVS